MSSMPPSPAWNVALYDGSHSFVWKRGEALLELLESRSGERIIDLGCGTGHLTAKIATSVAEVVGIDSSPEMIATARRSYPHLRFEIADARTFSLPELFDAVFSNAVLHWIKDPEAAIVRIRAALKPGGRYVAEFGGKGNTRQMSAALQRQAAAFGIDDYQLPWYFPGIAEYAGLLERHGFEVTYAALIDRPTPLEGDEGMRNWFEMFAGELVNRLRPEDRNPFLAAIENELRPKLYRDGTWFADYRRIRIVAHADSVG